MSGDNHHRWSGWPGAYCLDCGAEDPIEIALADGNYIEVEDPESPLGFRFEFPNVTETHCIAPRFRELLAELTALTAQWNATDLIPVEQQMECKRIGEELNKIGGIHLMRQAYYSAHQANRCASVVQAYWDGIGEWRW